MSHDQFEMTVATLPQIPGPYNQQAMVLPMFRADRTSRDHVPEVLPARSSLLCHPKKTVHPVHSFSVEEMERAPQ
jgi:hypothetical protein